ncbi:MAG: hypothetical protein A2V93_00120 [Ignavibacteria bacterium RBG_16_34_14]|nr:MAG: hypothetical protein A2V93_00120 [Ignavibacteria bacterium RBG_16_34_14]
MKKLFLFITMSIFNLASIYGQSGWNVDLRVDKENYITNTEINFGITADLYYNTPVIWQVVFTFTGFR